MKAEKAFTLIELLVAIVIFAIISVMAYGSLDSVLKTQEAISKQREQFQSLSRIIFQLQTELRYIMPRPVTNSFNSIEPALKLEQGFGVLLSFTRTGIPNLAGVARSPLQRIDYIFTEGSLKKRIWQVVDINDETAFKEQVLLEDLEEFKVEVLGRDNVWYQSWGESEFVDLLPIAIKVIFVTKKYGEITRLMDLPQ